jgi:hypothetical protein
MNVQNRGIGELSYEVYAYAPEKLYEVADGIIPKLADAFSYELDAYPNATNIGRLIGAIGPKETLRDNVTGVEQVLGSEDAIGLAHKFVVQSGIMDKVDGGLWLPNQKAPDDATMVVMGGVPRWARRSLDVAVDSPQEDLVIIGGPRRMDNASDVGDVVVQQLTQSNEVAPTEGEFLKELIEGEYADALASKRVHLFMADHSASSGLLQQFFERNPHYADRQLIAIRVANAALTFAYQLRLAARYVNPHFDTELRHQMYARSDEIQLATTKEQINDPAHYQSPVSAIRQIPVLAKEILSQPEIMKGIQ